MKSKFPHKLVRYVIFRFMSSADTGWKPAQRFYLGKDGWSDKVEDAVEYFTSAQPGILRHQMQSGELGRGGPWTYGVEQIVRESRS